MPKIKKITSVLAAVALCASLASCNEGSSPQKTTVTEQDTSVGSTVTDEEDYIRPETHKEAYYNHVALQGAVIVEQNGKAYFRFKKKCGICGYVAGGATGISAHSSRYNSYFRCPDCGNNQKIQIETARQY